MVEFQALVKGDEFCGRGFFSVHIKAHHTGPVIANSACDSGISEQGPNLGVGAFPSSTLYFHIICVFL